MRIPSALGWLELGLVEGESESESSIRTFNEDLASRLVQLTDFDISDMFARVSANKRPAVL